MIGLTLMENLGSSLDPEGLDGGVGRLLAVADDRGNTGGLVEHGPKIDGVLSSRTLGRCIIARVIVSWSGIYDSACGPIADEVEVEIRVLRGAVAVMSVVYQRDYTAGQH
jgi:hypothetical protein